MLELQPIRDVMVGTTSTGGMSFEQKKRVSIGVELAANPSILFLGNNVLHIYAYYINICI